MIIYLNNSHARRLAEKHPGRIGYLFGPSRTRPVFDLRYVLDNDRFSVWQKGKQWDEKAYFKMLDNVGDTLPQWVVVPDVVGDADATFREWEKWHPVLAGRGLTLALAVQDGMTPASVRLNTDPDVIFIGGTTDWKRSTVWNWCYEFPRVHVGRVNTERWLWNAHNCGAESTDGTGWFRGDQAQLRGLLRYLMKTDRGIGPDQLVLEFARTFGGNVPRKSDIIRGR